MTPAEIRSTVSSVLDSTPVLDIHTHTFAPWFGALGLWGLDELLPYHYLEAELFRSRDVTPEAYWSLGKREQADLIWETLFVRNAPISEATRGVVAVLKAFNLPADAENLNEARAFFSARRIDEHVDAVFALADRLTVMVNGQVIASDTPVNIRSDAAVQAAYLGEDVTEGADHV